MRITILALQTEKYGLTFVKFHSQPEEGGGDVVSEEGMIGAFKLREEVKDLPPGSFFFRKEQQDKEGKQVKPAVTAAAQARMASAAALKDDATGPPVVAKVPSPAVSSPTAAKGVVSRSPVKGVVSSSAACTDVEHRLKIDKPSVKVR